LPSRLLYCDTAHILANTEHSDLPEADRLVIGHAKDVQSGEVRTQDPGALVQALERYDQHQHALNHQPAERVVQKQALQSVVAN
jgi:hypothetical protein